jgi:hypothetical protein
MCQLSPGKNSTKRARLTATLSGTKNHNVLVVALDNGGGRGVVVRSLLHIFIINVTSDLASDDRAASVGRLSNRVALLGCDISITLAVGVDDGSCSARGIGPVRTPI